MQIDDGRRARLDRVMSDIGAIRPAYAACPNPNIVDVTFSLADVRDGDHVTGARFFDLRKGYTAALARRGFEMMVDNQGVAPFGMSVRDVLPEGCQDGEILGLDRDGSIIQWNADDLETYNCGDTPEEFGVDNIRPHEAERLGRCSPAVV